MRALLTPSRIVVLAISLSLFTFLWTFGVPHRLPQPAPAFVDHGSPQLSPQATEKPALTSLFAFEPEQAHKTATVHDATLSALTRKPTSRPKLNQQKPGSSSSSTSSRIAEDKSNKQAETLHYAQHGGGNATGSSLAPYPTGKNGTILAYGNSTRIEKNCRDIPGASDIMVVVKTSKVDMQEKLQAHLGNLLPCVPHFAIFSDHSGLAKNYTVYDALEDISYATKAKHDEFLDYEKLRTLPNARQVPLSKELDKWKMLPMVYKAYKMRPDSRFYLFIEPETSMSWTNLLQWIGRLDSRIPYYSGAPLAVGSLKFAQRGSGIMLSNAAMALFAKAYDEMYASDWETRVGNECCGDVVLARAMADSLVELYGSHPLVQADTPASLAWSPKSWCVPSVGWHNMTNETLTELWSAEKNWTREHGWEEPYVLRDVFTALVQPQMVERKDEWDNEAMNVNIVKPTLEDLGSEDSQEWFTHDEETRQAVTSWKKCQAACELVPDCHQWKFTKNGAGACHLGRTIRLGKAAPKVKGEQKWTSGWMVERVFNTTRDWECKEPIWRFNQVP